MSCFIVKPENVSMIADYLEIALNIGRAYTGFPVRENLRKTFADCRIPCGAYDVRLIYDRLTALNLAAFIGRYAEAEPIPEIPYTSNKKPARAQWDVGHYTIEPWHYEMLKRLDCYLYQCDEDANKDSKLLAALCEFRADFANFILENHPAYAAAPWA